MAWDKSKPANNSALVSAEIRANWDALDAALIAPLVAASANQLFMRGATAVLAPITPGSNGQILTLVSGVPTWAAAPTSGFANPMTTLGDLIKGGASGVAQRLGVGSNGQVLSVVAGEPAWAASPNPMTTPGDMIVGGASGAATRLPVGTDGYVLRMVSGVPTWVPLSPAIVALPLEAARFPDGSSSANLFPQPVERISTGSVVAPTPKLVELVYQFDPTGPEWLLWKGAHVPLDYLAGGTVTAVVKWSMAAAPGAGSNIRIQASMGCVADDSMDARAVITGAVTISSDLAIPGTLGFQKETRLALTLANIPNLAAGRKFLFALSLYSASASNATVADRVLEACWLEFQR